MSGVVLVSMLPTGDAFRSISCPILTFSVGASAAIVISTLGFFTKSFRNGDQVNSSVDSEPETSGLIQGKLGLMNVAWERGTHSTAVLVRLTSGLGGQEISRRGKVYKSMAARDWLPEH